MKNTPHLIFSGISRKFIFLLVFCFFPLHPIYGQSLTIVPNPSLPTVTREDPGIFHVADNPNAYQWVRADMAGIVFSFDYYPEPPGTKVTVKIFDSFNSLVLSKSDVIGNYSSPNGGRMTANIYWNGTTSKGDFVHEGTYSVEIRQDPPGQAAQIFKSTFYMMKPASGRSTCGGNYAIAFFPAIWFKTRRPLFNFLRKLFKKPKKPC